MCDFSLIFSFIVILSLLKEMQKGKQFKLPVLSDSTTQGCRCLPCQLGILPGGVCKPVGVAWRVQGGCRQTSCLLRGRCPNQCISRCQPTAWRLNLLQIGVCFTLSG